MGFLSRSLGILSPFFSFFDVMGIGPSTLELAEVRAGLMATGTGHPESSVAVLKSATVQLEKSGTEDFGSVVCALTSMRSCLSRLSIHLAAALCLLTTCGCACAHSLSSSSFPYPFHRYRKVARTDDRRRKYQPFASTTSHTPLPTSAYASCEPLLPSPPPPYTSAWPWLWFHSQPRRHHYTSITHPLIR